MTQLPDCSQASIEEDATPVIRTFAERIVVIKVGGEIVGDEGALESFAKDVSLLKRHGVRPVVCHGGGPQVSEAMQKAGKAPTFVDGLRVTDDETLEITATVFLGLLNRKIIGALGKAGCRAAGFSGIDDNTLIAEQLRPELGFVGKIAAVNTGLLDVLLQSGITPVIAPLAVNGEGAVFNVNADTVAGEIARKFSAAMLLLLTNVTGIFRDFNDKQSFIAKIAAKELRELIQSGDLEGGILPKAEAAIAGATAPNSRSVIVDGRTPRPILRAILGLDGCGTVVIPD